MADPILQINNLKINFYTENGRLSAVDDLNISLMPGEIMGLVGESGCGKSVSALSVLRLIPMPPAKIESGEIIWDGRDLLKLSIDEMIKIRGKEIGVIFQEPLTSFNPVQKIGDQIGEVLRVHSDLSKEEIKQKVISALERVGINNPERQYNAYPHELSGGMRQRAMIAMALICKPKMVIADEPTTALDVTIQAQILELLKELQSENQTAVLMITHNLGIVAEMAQRVAVMYAGKIVETTDVKEIFKNPLHPYTKGLLACVPKISGQDELYAIPGNIPDPVNLPTGCRFEPRCSYAMEICRKECPALKENSPGHYSACWLNEKQGV